MASNITDEPQDIEYNSPTGYSQDLRGFQELTHSQQNHDPVGQRLHDQDYCMYLVDLENERKYRNSYMFCEEDEDGFSKDDWAQVGVCEPH